MSEEAQDREKEIIAKMTKYFVPINTTDLVNVVPENDRILCSLMCSGKLIAEAPPSHVLITSSGIAYRFLSVTNQFRYWHSRPGIEIKLKKSKIMVDRYRLFFDRNAKYLYSEEVYTLLKDNFAPYCKILSRNFQEQLEETFELIENEVLLKSKLTNENITEFFNTIQIYHQAGYSDEVFQIVEKSLEIIPKSNKGPFLHLFAKIYNFKAIETEKFYCKSKLISEMLLPLYKKLVGIYDCILDLEPNNEEVTKQKEAVQNNYNYYTVPYYDRKKAHRLFGQGFLKYNEDKYEEALHYFEESCRLNPYTSGLKGHIDDLLKELGR